MAANDHTASSRQLPVSWSTATGVLVLASSIRCHLLHRGLLTTIPLYRIPFTANHQPLHLQWAHEHRTWQINWQQVVFSDESYFNLLNQEGRIRVKFYASERCLSKCIIERHSDRTPRVMVWVRFNVIDNLSCYELRQDNSHPHVAKTVRDFGSAQHMQLLPWPAYSLDLSPIEQALDLVGRLLTRDPSPTASKDELWLPMQTISNYLPLADIPNLFESMSRRIATLIAAHGVTPNTNFGNLILFFI
ncbi:transposable element Tcb2 transposase [Trichonephila clavipes]|nr:transposable element Tcb2 transposase [Trichonephila clavipes]